MKGIISAWKKTPSIIRILIGLVLGIVLGLVAKSWTWIAIFGTLFVGALKAVAPILVFLLVVSSLTRSKKNIGNRFGRVIFLYMMTTLCAAVVATIASYTFNTRIPLAEAATESAPSGLGEVFSTLLSNVVSNPIAALANANYIGILFWAVVFGLCLRTMATENTISFFEEVSSAVTKIISYIVAFAPLGILGLVYETVSTNGVEVFTVHGYLVAVLVGAMLVSALIINPIIVGLHLKRNPYPLVLTCLRESGITAFFTRSSAANIPVNMKLCDRLGLDEDFYSVSIPLGSAINMNGAAITITILTMATCHTMGVSVNILMAFLLCIVSVLGACGASGVAGGSLLLIPMACSLFGISVDVAMQAVAVGFIIGVIQDSVETALNSSGDAIFTATAEYYDRRKKGLDMEYLGHFAKK